MGLMLMSQFFFYENVEAYVVENIILLTILLYST